MFPRLLFSSIIFVLMFVHPSHADEEFTKNNPDIMKYEFVRSYITALGYIKDINTRWDIDAKSDANYSTLTTQQKNKMILGQINDLALDSSDLLIIKHYMLKYLTSPNILMRKVAGIVVVATSREIAINHEEKSLWQKWYNLISAGQATRPKEIELVKTQYGLELQRKEADKDIIQASVLMTKVLISDKNKDGQGRLLAITAQQRQKLLDHLDSFGSDDLDWGLKPKQRTLESSVSVIREILEDSIWISIDEK